MRNIRSLILEELGRNGGLLRLAPAWVPRSFMMPGRRLKLHPADLYALGAHRGGINERWFASTTRADNGPGTPEDEGLSYIIPSGGASPEKVLLKEAIEEAGEAVIGKAMLAQYGGWPIFAKFFDNMGPIPHHVHLMDEHAARVGRLGKPEAYYFPPQQNFTDNYFAYTFFGLEHGTTKDEVVDCLRRWDEGDNGILRFSRAYRLTPGTGWDVPPGILHAPGSLLTYEPQRASDVYLMFQSLVEGRAVPRDLLVKDVPQDKYYDFDYLVSVLDWELNVDPEFMRHRYREPVPVWEEAAMREGGYIEKWITYGSDYFSAKELTVLPGRTAVIHDAAAYGLIMVQGHGSMNGVPVETPTMIRFGQMTSDEFFVSESAAKAGVTVVNPSDCDSIVMLKHFGPGNTDAAKVCYNHR